MSFLRLGTLSVFHCCKNAYPGSIRQRFMSMDYKPKDHIRYVEAVEALAHKDLTLFAYEAPRRVNMSNLLGLSMFPLWTYLAYSVYSVKGTLRPYEVSEKHWALKNVMNGATGVSIAFFVFGLASSSYWISRTMNTVRRLVLKKGGKHVTLVTYGILGQYSRQITVPVSHCTAVHEPFRAKQMLFLRVRNRPFKFQFNVQDGTFFNKPLFDRIVGISRKI